MFLADVFDLTQDDRTQKIRFAGDDNSIRFYPVDGKFAYYGFEFMRRTKYLYARYCATAHCGVIIKHRNHGLPSGSVGLKQLNKCRGEAICADNNAAFTAGAVIICPLGLALKNSE